MKFESSGISIRRFTRIEPDGRTLMLDVLVADAPLEAVWSSRIRVDYAAPGDMSPRSVALRLREMSDVSELCAHLATGRVIDR